MIEPAGPGVSDWERRLEALLPVFGHRNWIVVADAAYPAQSKPGIETVATHADHMEVLRRVSGAISASFHVRANIHLDHELAELPEADAPGVSRYRKELSLLLGESKPARTAHEQIIAQLDQAAELFHILILKTKMTIPYSSVFFELDCGYWDSEAERRLRHAIPRANP